MWAAVTVYLPITVEAVAHGASVRHGRCLWEGLLAWLARAGLGNRSRVVGVVVPVSSGPNPAAVAWSILKARRTSVPGPFGAETLDHARLTPILEALRDGGIGALIETQDELGDYLDGLRSVVEPGSLTREDALAFWLNLYNAGSLRLAAEAAASHEDSVLRVPGAFQRPFIEIAGEALSLDEIEHGKIRRFRDPRIHGALVCGSVSCPTLRGEPYEGFRLDAQLGDQMTVFLSGGGLYADRSRGTLRLSRVFLWYGGDFTRPGRMPAWLPARPRALVGTLIPWLHDETAEWISTARPKIAYQSYDWGLRCAVR